MNLGYRAFNYFSLLSELKWKKKEKKRERKKNGGPNNNNNPVDRQRLRSFLHLSKHPEEEKIALKKVG